MSVYGADVGAFGSPMPTTTPKTEKPKRETWRDWMPEGSEEPKELFSREEFLSRLNDLGLDVTESDLRFWEYHGVLPRAIKQWSNGANRVFYPRWMIETVALLRALQGTGLSLQEITPQLRDTVSQSIDYAHMLESRSDNWPGYDALMRWRAHLYAASPFFQAIVPELEGLARRYELITGKSVAKIVVSLRDDDNAMLDSFDHELGGET